jgi:hypothetical protein
MLRGIERNITKAIRIDQELGAAILQLFDIFVGRKTIVQRHHGERRFRAGDGNRHIFGNIRQHNADAIALCKAKRQQRVGHPVGQIIERSVTDRYAVKMNRRAIAAALERK